MRDLQTTNYKLAVSTGAGKGTFIIIRLRDNASTSRFTGTEGAEDYIKFRRAYNISGASFDELCAAETFTDGDITQLPHVIVTGNPGQGFQLYGPFDDFIAASEYMEQNGTPDNDWWIMPVNPASEM